MNYWMQNEKNTGESHNISIPWQIKSEIFPLFLNLDCSENKLINTDNFSMCFKSSLKKKKKRHGVVNPDPLVANI